MKDKGCVVEVRDKTLLLMTNSCDFVEIPKKNKGVVFPGLEIEYETRPEKVAFPRKWMAVAAMVMVLIMGSLLMLPANGAIPVYVASIDINPSLDMLIDETGHVVEVQPMNPDAKSLTIRNMKGKPVEEAVSSLMDQLFEQGYFDDRIDHYMVFSLTAIDSSIQQVDMTNMMIRLGNSIEEEKRAREIHLEVLSYAAMEEELKEAESADISLNYMLVRNQYQAMISENAVETVDEQVDESMEAMVRSILKEKQHPVFEEHPGADPGGSKTEKDDAPPENIENDDKGQGAEKQKEQEHPVFEQHPGNPDQGNDGKEQTEQRKDLPVFQGHPGDADRENDRENGSDNQGNRP